MYDFDIIFVRMAKNMGLASLKFYPKIKLQFCIMSFQSHVAHMSALTSDSMALSQAPAKAARPWTRGQCFARCACLPLSAYAGTKLYCLVTEALCVNNFCKVALDSAAAGIEPVIFNHKSNALTTIPPSHTV